MNKKILKLFLTTALGLSLLCAAQTVNAMEDESVSTIKDSKLNNLSVDEKAKIIKLLDTSFNRTLVSDYMPMRRALEKDKIPEYDRFNDLIIYILSRLKSKIFSNYYLNEISDESKQKIKETTLRFLANLIDYENFSYEDRFDSAFKTCKKANPNLSIEEFRKRSLVIFRSAWTISRFEMVIFKIAEELGIDKKELEIEKTGLRTYEKYIEDIENPDDTVCKKINDYKKLALLEAYKNIIQNCEKLISCPVVSAEDFANKLEKFLELHLKPAAQLKNTQPNSAKNYNNMKGEVIGTDASEFLSEIKDDIKKYKFFTKEEFITRIKKLFMGFGEKLEIELDEKDFEIAQNDLTKEKTNSLNQVSAQPSSNNLIADQTQSSKEAESKEAESKEEKVDVSNQVSAQPSSNNLIADKTEALKKAELKEEKVDIPNQVSAQPSSNNLIAKEQTEALKEAELKEEKVDIPDQVSAQPSNNNLITDQTYANFKKKLNAIIAELNKENNLVAEQKPINSQVDFKISDDQIIEIIMEFEKTFVYSEWSNTNIKRVVKCLISSILCRLMNYLKINNIDKLTNNNFKTTRKEICSFVLNSIENPNTSIKDAFSENEFTKFRCKILVKCFEAIKNMYKHKILSNSQIKYLKKMANI